MDLGNLVNAAVHYLLTGEMAYLSSQDGFLMMSALVYVMYIR